MMRTSVLWSAVGMAVVIGAGCDSSGLSYRETPGSNQSHYLNTLYADAGVSRLRPGSFRPPAGVAVAQIGEVTPPQVMLDRLRQEERLFTRVEGIPAVADDEGNIYADRRSVSSARTRRHIDALRGMASTMGLDYLLLVGGTIDQSTAPTAWSVLNLTVVGAFVVPADETQALVKASGAMIDVRTGQVVSISTAEVDGKTYAPRFAGANSRVGLLKDLRDRVTTDLAANVARDCGRIKSTRSY